MPEWTKGQEVALRTGYERDVYTLTTITRITPSGQIVLANGLRFNLDGWERTSEPNPARIFPVTDEIRARIQHKLLVAWIQTSLQHGQHTPDQLRRIAAILGEPREQEGDPVFTCPGCGRATHIIIGGRVCLDCMTPPASG